jgi:hypothetical protein
VDEECCSCFDKLKKAESFGDTYLKLQTGKTATAAKCDFLKNHSQILRP